MATERARKLAQTDHWQELMRLRSSPTWDDNVALVLTTADGSGLRRWMTGPRSGEAAVVEMFTHAADLRELRDAVSSAVRARHPQVVRKVQTLN